MIFTPIVGRFTVSSRRPLTDAERGLIALAFDRCGEAVAVALARRICGGAR